VNADDFGMCHSNNEAILRAMTEGVVTSTTLMTPCPWAPQAMRMLRENPNLAFGVHLTIIAEQDEMRWGPLAPRDKVSSLIDEEGYFFRNSRRDEMLSVAPIEEVELEFRTQIDTVLKAGLKPTHPDSHCLYDGGRPDIFELMRDLAKEHGLALRVFSPRRVEESEAEGLPVPNRGVIDSYMKFSEGTNIPYEELLRALPAGLNEWAIHPGLGDAEAKAMEPDSWWIRKGDLDFLTSPDARRIIEEEGIVLLDYRPLQEKWRRS
jgi:predicted glycoside hydrolase/deacetylase ChbG (UPF0249 family)